MTAKDFKRPFELSSIDDENAVFKKHIQKSGKSPKAIRDLKANLPTTTIHYVSDQDFERLKEIEAKILLELRSVEKYRSDNLLKLMRKFLEI